MSDERKPVMCPNCKSAMQCVHDGGFHNGPQHWYQFACDCGVSTPWKDTVEAAYAAATATPPNRLMTLEQNEITRIRLLQYERLRKNFYALIESVLGKDYYNLGMDVYACDAMACEDIANKIGAKWIAQPADIEAARKERTT